jgi:DNA polymerase-3 subunit gamma/tau
MADGHYLVLARKWRPQSFEEVVGQEHITRTIQNAMTSGRIGHAFLFIGSRGIGKTTTARILAKALNCAAAEAPTPNPCGECETCVSIAEGNSIDVIEIDGASNNSVEDVRQIRENIQLVPSGSRYKIYIIDEVHQLSPGAFNALLKTLEEPPAHAIFVLATTETHKLPATIISRCQRYDFRRVGIESIQGLLKRILDAEGRKYTDEALYAIARAADGGIRDSESILEQVISYAGDNITYEAVYEVLGLVEWSVLHSLCDAIIAKDVATQLQIVEDVVVSGKDLPQFMEEILGYFRNLLVCKTADGEHLLALPAEEIAAMEARAAKFSLTELIRMVEQFSELFKRDFDTQLAPRIALEALLIRCSKVGVELSVDTILEKLAQLGAGGITGSGTPSAPPAQTGKAPPPDPPKPLSPAKPRSAAEAAPKRITLTESNFAKSWIQVQEAAGISLAIWLGQAAFGQIADGQIALRFKADQAKAVSILTKAEHRDQIESALVKVTDNVQTFRCDMESPPPKAAVASANGKTANVPTAGRVDPSEAKTALEDPGLSQVVDVFRGRIVEVKTEATEGDPSAEDQS